MRHLALLYAQSLRDRQQAALDRQQAVLDRQQAVLDRQQAALNSKKADDRWNELVSRLDNLSAKVGITYEIAVRGILPKRVQAKLHVSSISEFLNRIFEKNSNGEDFNKLEATLLSSGYLHLLQLLPSDAAATLSINPPRIEIDIYGYVANSTSTQPSGKVRSSPTKQAVAPLEGRVEDCDAVVIAETTTGMICGLDLWEQLPQHDDNLQDWLRSRAPGDGIRVHALIAKLLQLERQVTFLNIHYGSPDLIAHVFLIDPIYRRYDEAQDLPPLIFARWGSYLPALNALFSSGRFSLYSGTGDIVG